MLANNTFYDSYQGYRGFIPDILRELENIMGVPFEIYLVKDGKYGSNVNDSWTGMIGDVIKKEVSMR